MVEGPQPKPADSNDGSISGHTRGLPRRQRLFESGKVSCVIDWDKARPEVPARELVRAMDYASGWSPCFANSSLGVTEPLPR